MILAKDNVNIDNTMTLPLEPTLKSVTITTDGACQPNPGRGGWAAVMRYGNVCKEIGGTVEETTNNRMEMLAAAMAMESLREPCNVTLRTDSQVIVGLLRGTGMKPHKRANQDLVQRLVAMKVKHRVNAIWVKGHNGDPDNERADRLSNDWATTPFKVTESTT
jgi:ribonuclease HI